MAIAQPRARFWQVYLLRWVSCVIRVLDRSNCPILRGRARELNAILRSEPPWWEQNMQPEVHCPLKACVSLGGRCDSSRRLQASQKLVVSPGQRSRCILRLANAFCPWAWGLTPAQLWLFSTCALHRLQQGAYLTKHVKFLSPIVFPAEEYGTCFVLHRPYLATWQKLAHVFPSSYILILSCRWDPDCIVQELYYIERVDGSLKDHSGQYRKQSFWYLFYLASWEGTGLILLVCQDQQRRSCKPLLFQKVVQLSLAIFHSPCVGTVNHPDHSVCGFEVIPPVWAQGFLPAHIPYVELWAARQMLFTQILLWSLQYHMIWMQENSPSNQYKVRNAHKPNLFSSPQEYSGALQLSCLWNSDHMSSDNQFDYLLKHSWDYQQLVFWPAMLDALYLKAKCGTDSGGIFILNLLDNRSLSSVVQAPAMYLKLLSYKFVMISRHARTDYGAGSVQILTP